VIQHLIRYASGSAAVQTETTPASTGLLVSTVGSVPNLSLPTPLISCIPTPCMSSVRGRNVFASGREALTARVWAATGRPADEIISSPQWGVRRFGALAPTPLRDDRCTLNADWNREPWLRIVSYPIMRGSLSSPDLQPSINERWGPLTRSRVYWSLTSSVAPRRRRVPARRTAPTSPRPRCRPRPRRRGPASPALRG